MSKAVERERKNTAGKVRKYKVIEKGGSGASIPGCWVNFNINPKRTSAVAYFSKEVWKILSSQGFQYATLLEDEDGEIGFGPTKLPEHNAYSLTYQKRKEPPYTIYSCKISIKKKWLERKGLIEFVNKKKFFVTEENGNWWVDLQSSPQ